MVATVRVLVPEPLPQLLVAAKGKSNALGQIVRRISGFKTMFI